MRHGLTVKVLALLAFCAFSGLWLATVSVPQAHAESGDGIDRYDIGYQVQPDGTVDVTETIEYRFSGGGRHGIYRKFLTREKWDESQDATYRISDFAVESPTGASTDFTQKGTGSGSTRYQQFQIGSSSSMVDSTETYVLHYTVGGAMRTSGEYDELYWDATGYEWDAEISNVSVTAQVPGGAKEVACFSGPPRSKDSCTTARLDGDRAVFGQDSLAEGAGVSIGVKIASGQVSDNAPHLVPSGDAEDAADQAAQKEKDRKAAITSGALTGVAALLAPLAGWGILKRNRDDRFLGVPPGVIPPEGQQNIGPSPKLEIPVAFAPPAIPVAEAGLLIDGVSDVEETAATIVDLAVRGAITISASGPENYQLTLNNRELANPGHEKLLLDSLFHGGAPGTRVDLGTPGALHSAHTVVAARVRQQAHEHGLFKRLRSGGRSTASVGVFAGVAAWIAFVNLGSLVVFAPLIPLVLVGIFIWRKTRRGTRTAVGRALTDQIEGFKLYLETAEADQLRFEEGEDIYSRYLPWAIMLGLADRWANLCRQLVQMGRLPDITPQWYVGHNFAFNVGLMTSSINSAVAAPPSSGGSGAGSGFGGGSSFGGGGFSGGGGGGGGGGSW